MAHFTPIHLEGGVTMLTHQGDSQLATKQCMDSLKLSVPQLLLFATGNPARGRLRAKAAERTLLKFGLFHPKK